jgi:alkylation response protein AidB-like acyl-CoA dehydrogenase
VDWQSITLHDGRVINKYDIVTIRLNGQTSKWQITGMDGYGCLTCLCTEDVPGTYQKGQPGLLSPKHIGKGLTVLDIRAPRYKDAMGHMEVI